MSSTDTTSNELPLSPNEVPLSPISAGDDNMPGQSLDDQVTDIHAAADAMNAMSLTDDTDEGYWPNEAGDGMCPQEDHCDCCYYPYVHPAETPVPGSKATLGHCPFEVISRIAFYLPDDSEDDMDAGIMQTGDINALALTNRFYYDCLNEDLYKANIKYGGSSGLYWAIANDRKDTLDLMIRYGADIHRTDNEGSTKYGLRWFEGCGNALHVAIAHKRVDIANFLLDSGSDASALTVPDEDDGGHARSALELAIRAELSGLAIRLIAMDPDLNRENEKFQTPLQQVLMKHDFKNPADRLLILGQLLQMGADVNCASVNDFAFPGDPSGDAPLNLAFRWGDCSGNSVRDEKQVIQMLLVYGADIHERVGPDEKGEVMHHACLRGWDDIVKDLLMRGANVNARDDQGLTPLAYAVNMCVLGSAEAGQVELHFLRCDEYQWTGNVETVKLLLKHGADPDAMSMKGWTPRKIAALNTNESFIKEFKDELLVGEGFLETPEVLCERPIYGLFDYAEYGTNFPQND